MLEAEGRKEAAFRDAEARERSAQAEATATRVLSEAIASGDVAALNYSIAEKYVRALASFAQAPNQKTFIVPMELSGLAGTLGGISALAASAFGEARAEDGGAGGGQARGRAAVPPPRRRRSPRRRRRGATHERGSAVLGLDGGRPRAVVPRDAGSRRFPDLHRPRRARRRRRRFRLSAAARSAGDRLRRARRGARARRQGYLWFGRAFKRRAATSAGQKP